MNAFDSLPRLLLVEHSPDDADTMVRALRAWQSRLPILVVVSDAAARHELSRTTPGHVGPRLIVIDLPDDDAVQLLGWIKSTANLRRIPVVMLVTSPDGNAIARRYERGANGALVKRDRAHLPLLMQAIAKYWIKLNELPSASSAEGDS